MESNSTKVLRTMSPETLWSLRLGYSTKQAEEIRSLGLASFLDASYNAAYNQSEPDCLLYSPRTLQDLVDLRSKLRSMSGDDRKAAAKQFGKETFELQKWWVGMMRSNPYPLREKMVCFWHNHFVATSKKVRMNYWVYQHNQILRENAFGNFRELTKQMVRSNAMIRYLDNGDNRKGQANENLSRELLELFTLGIGNYTEDDIKEGAKALAGLNVGVDEGFYRRRHRYDDYISYLGSTGRYDSDDLVDVIFNQPSAPYLITRKLLQWFLYDQPDEALVIYYGDYLREVDFEIQPLFTKMMLEEDEKGLSGRKIKDPLVYILQIMDDLQMPESLTAFPVYFARMQGMRLFNQPNVKGWIGGNAWITSQIFLHRNQTADRICKGRILEPIDRKAMTGPIDRSRTVDYQLNWSKEDDPYQIIEKLSDHTLFQVDENLQLDMESIVTHDFNPNSPKADEIVLRLYNYIIKTPEFQLI